MMVLEDKFQMSYDKIEAVYMVLRKLGEDDPKRFQQAMRQCQQAMRLIQETADMIDG